MSNQLYPILPRVVDTNINASPGAKLTFYVSGTTTPLTVYTTEDCDVAHPSPLVADADGSVPSIWVPSGAAKVVVTDAADASLFTIDPVVATAGAGLSASDIPFSPTVELPFENVQDAVVGAAASAAAGYGVFGLGITGNATLLAAMDATNIGAGTYRFDATTTGTYPTGVAAADGGIIEHWRQSSGAAMQMLYHATTDRIFHRRMTASAWGTWRENITTNQGATQGDILYRGASAWTRLAKGTALQVLRQNAGLTAPEWADLTPVATTTTSAGPGTTVNVTGWAGWEAIDIDIVTTKANTGLLYLRVSFDNGGSYQTAGYAGGTSDFGSDSTDTIGHLLSRDTTGITFRASLRLSFMASRGVLTGHNYGSSAFETMHSLAPAGTINAIRLFSSGGNLTSTTIHVTGARKV